MSRHSNFFRDKVEKNPRKKTKSCRDNLTLCRDIYLKGDVKNNYQDNLTTILKTQILKNVTTNLFTSRKVFQRSRVEHQEEIVSTYSEDKSVEELSRKF